MQSLGVDGVRRSRVIKTQEICQTVARVEHWIDPNALACHPHDIDLLRQAPEIIGVVIHQLIEAIHRGKLHATKPLLRTLHGLLLHIEGEEARLIDF